MDKDPKFTKRLEHVLKTMNVEVKVSNDHRSGFELILKEEFDIVVIDMDAQEFKENSILDFLALNSQLNDQKLILLTKPNLEKKLKNRLSEYGVYSYFTKPLELDMLANAITKSNSKSNNNPGINTIFSN